MPECANAETVKLKICHVTTSFIHRAGPARWLYAILNEQKLKGHEITLIVGRDYQPSPRWQMSGINVVQVKELTKYIYLVKDFIALYKLYKLLSSIKPDVIHTQLAKAGILGRLAASYARVPNIFHTVHGPTFSEYQPVRKRMIFRSLESMCGKCTDRFIFVGNDIKRQYIRESICREDNSSVITYGPYGAEINNYNAMTTDEIKSVRKSLGKNENDFLLVYVARIVPSKAMEKSIAILDLLRKQGVNSRLIIVGAALLKEEQNYKARLLSLISKMGLSDHIHFTGYKENIIPIMKACDVVIMTSKWEGLPNVVVESAIAKRPMVAFNVNGVKEIIEDGKSGFVLEQDDLSGFAARLKYLFEYPRAASEMGKLSYRRVALDYTMERMVSMMANLYDSVLAMKSANGKKQD